jgi:hypothetical protein
MLDKAPRMKNPKKTQQLLLLYYVRWMLADYEPQYIASSIIYNA